MQEMRVDISELAKPLTMTNLQEPTHIEQQINWVNSRQRWPAEPQQESFRVIWRPSHKLDSSQESLSSVRSEPRAEPHMVFLIPWRNGAWKGYSCGVRDTICVCAADCTRMYSQRPVICVCCLLVLVSRGAGTHTRYSMKERDWLWNLN